MQLTYPGTKISTLEEVFAFAECADPNNEVHWNIESKINAVNPNYTRGVEDFVTKQHALFVASRYRRSSITVSYVLPNCTRQLSNLLLCSTKVLIGGR